MAGKLRYGKGLDVGTVNLVAAEQTEDGQIHLRKKRNVFIEIQIDQFTKNILARQKVDYVQVGKKFYILGDPAFELANILNKSVRRPMKDGLISPREQEALPIMKLLIESIVGKPRIEKEPCYYSVPADPIDSEMNVTYHKEVFGKLLQTIGSGYEAKPIQEGYAVVLAELVEEDFTGIGVSCGGGMFNVCVAYKSIPAVNFSTSRAGDWVDSQVAKSLGMKVEKAALLKEKGVDLLAPKNREEEAITIYYRSLISYTLKNIKERFEMAENKPDFPDPVAMIFSGGTSLPLNFCPLVDDELKKFEGFPIPIKEVRHAKDALNATARGAHRAAMLEQMA